MGKVNVLYHKQTNSWWVDKNLDGFTLRNYINENITGLGTIEMDTIDKMEIKDSSLFEIESGFIPKHFKLLNGITEELEENGLNNTTKISNEQLKQLLD